MSNQSTSVRGQRTRSKRRVSLDGLQLVEGPAIPGHCVHHNDARCLLIIDNLVPPYTRTQYQILMQLLHAEGGYATLEALAEQVLQSPLNQYSREALTQHISRMRDTTEFAADLDIACIHNVGYMVRPLPEHLRRTTSTKKPVENGRGG